jgi:K+-transporting ATPase A subunit
MADFTGEPIGRLRLTEATVIAAVWGDALATLGELKRELNTCEQVFALQPVFVHGTPYSIHASLKYLMVSQLSIVSMYGVALPGYLILSIQPWMPLNPQHKGLLSPTTIFNSAVSFMTNTNLQDYSGDQHLSNFSQIFFCIPNFFLSAAMGLCALTAIIRLFRGEKKIGNFFVDMWRVVVYIFLPVAFLLSLVFVQQGMPMSYRSSYQVSTLEPAAMGTTDSGQAKQQTIVVGPLAAFVPQTMLGTNGGGFYGMNSAHPLENPTAVTNFLTTFGMMIFPFCLVLMYGRAAIRREIDQILQANAKAPFGGLAGEKMVNVLEVDLELRKRYGAPKLSSQGFISLQVAAQMES